MLALAFLFSFVTTYIICRLLALKSTTLILHLLHMTSELKGLQLIERIQKATINIWSMTKKYHYKKIIHCIHANQKRMHFRQQKQTNVNKGASQFYFTLFFVLIIIVRFEILFEQNQKLTTNYKPLDSKYYCYGLSWSKL